MFSFQMAGQDGWEVLANGSYFRVTSFCVFKMRSIRWEAEFSVWLGEKVPQIVYLSENIIRNYK